MRDVVVAGGGPVGLATALYAARAGLDVEVWEPRAGVVDKACGEGLMPGAVAALAELGLAPPGHPIEGIRYVDGGRRAEARFRHGPGRGVRRTALHVTLRDAVEAAGVTVAERRVHAISDRGDHLLVDGEATRNLVAADGLHSPVRRMAGLERPAVRRRRHGLRHHVAVAPWTSFVEVHWSEMGEAYVTPVGEQEVGVAVLTEERRPLPALLTAFPELADRIGGAVATSTVRGAGPLRQRVRGRVAGRVLLVGDAAGYVDALTGEGIALGLGQARSAVDAIVAGDVERHERTCRRLGRRHELLTWGLLTATGLGPVRGRIVPFAARLPKVFEMTVDQLARPA